MTSPTIAACSADHPEAEDARPIRTSSSREASPSGARRTRQAFYTSSSSPATVPRVAAFASASEGDGGADGRTIARQAVDSERAIQRLDAVDQTAQTGAALRIRA